MPPQQARADPRREAEQDVAGAQIADLRAVTGLHGDVFDWAAA